MSLPGSQSEVAGAGLGGSDTGVLPHPEGCGEPRRGLSGRVLCCVILCYVCLCVHARVYVCSSNGVIGPVLPCSKVPHPSVWPGLCCITNTPQISMASNNKCFSLVLQTHQLGSRLTGAPSDRLHALCLGFLPASLLRTSVSVCLVHAPPSAWRVAGTQSHLLRKSTLSVHFGQPPVDPWSGRAPLAPNLPPAPQLSGKRSCGPLLQPQPSFPPPDRLPGTTL